MARSRLDPEQTDALEAALIRIYKGNPTEPYQDALRQVYRLLPELTSCVSIKDLNYRVPKLRRQGAIPDSPRSARNTVHANGEEQHPVAMAYQELDSAKRELDQAQQRFDLAEENLRQILRESLPPDFLETLSAEEYS